MLQTIVSFGAGEGTYEAAGRSRGEALVAAKTILEKIGNLSAQITSQLNQGVKQRVAIARLSEGKMSTNGENSRTGKG